MSKEKTAVVFNPCKYCLKRPVCKQVCTDLKNHSETQEIMCVLSIFVIITFLAVFGLLTLYLFYPTKTTSCIIALLIGAAYGSTILQLINEYDEEFKNYNFIKKFLVILFGPTSILTAYLFYNFNFDNVVNDYSRRYFMKGTE